MTTTISKRPVSNSPQSVAKALEGPSLTQWYTGFVLSWDAFSLFVLWTQPPRRLSTRTLWFDRSADDSHGARLYSFVVFLIMASAVLSLLNSMNRWVLLHHCFVESLRIVLFSLLMARMAEPTNLNTFLLSLMWLNVIIHVRNWYATWCQLCENAYEKRA